MHLMPKGEENILHVLRDCVRAKPLWLSLVPSCLQPAFFSPNLRAWLETNLRRYRTDPDGRWASIFAIGCWMLWGWRNKELFEADFMRPSNMAAPVLQFSSTSRQAISSANKFAKSSREWRWISWNKPLHEWLKLNTDGASKGNPRLAGAGGVLRDCNGRWVDGLAHNIGVSSAMVAELWGAPHRLEICLGSRA
ncbi:hypothetical protein CDL15_Pgr001041 [Punica granatum]|uniref:RNase H type-1 domain-containing protein n=1 Tax=Punica granatum TaxID=22663 RepID=A0A218X0Z6_PUNGR|nr:hypothetical protein CDL15_Pgr001041 [Punica granatum]